MFKGTRQVVHGPGVPERHLPSLKYARQRKNGAACADDYDIWCQGPGATHGHAGCVWLVHRSEGTLIQPRVVAATNPSAQTQSLQPVVLMKECRPSLRLHASTKVGHNPCVARRFVLLVHLTYILCPCALATSLSTFWRHHLAQLQRPTLTMSPPALQGQFLDKWAASCQIIHIDAETYPIAVILAR